MRVQAMKSTKIIKDVIHQFVMLPGDFVATAIDRPLFQRLRDIKQLSLTYLVYPGATHTRFEHSLGVAYVMATALKSIVRNTIEHVLPVLGFQNGSCNPPHNNFNNLNNILSYSLCNFIIKILEKIKELEGAAVTAALYHDIGHISLSHSGEEGLRDLLLYFTPNPKITKSTFIIKRMNHEKLGLSLLNIMHNAGKLNIIYKNKSVNPNDVLEILQFAYDSKTSNCNSIKLKGPEEPRLDRYFGSVDRLEVADGPEDAIAKKIAKCLIGQLLSSPIDVDRADYTLRDSLHSGSRSGIWDITRYYSVLLIVPRITASINTWEYKVQFHIGVLDKGVSVIESMLLSRVYMYNDVYLHDIGMIYSALASRLIALMNTIARYSTMLAKNNSEIKKLLSKYEFLAALRKVDMIEALSKDKSLSINAYEDAVQTFMTLTDSPLLDLTRRIAIGSASDLLDFIINISNYTTDNNSQWFKDACASIVLISRAITFRRHWKALMLSDERATRIIENFERIPGELSSPEANLLKDKLNPFLIIHWSSYVPYKGEGKSKVYVFRRRNPLRPEELERCKDAKVISKLVGISYSKILLAVPNNPDNKRENDDIQLHGWYWRGGKLTREDLEAASTWCKIDYETLKSKIKESSIDAVNMAISLVETL